MPKLGHREMMLVEEKICENDFRATIRTAKDGIKEMFFDSTDPWLSLAELKDNYREFSYDRAIVVNHPCIELGKEISELMGIHIINAALPYYYNDEHKVNLAKSVKGKQLIILGSRVRSFCDESVLEKRFYSPSDNYEQLINILQSIFLSRNKGTTGFIVTPYISCAKKDKKEGRDNLPMIKVGNDFAKFTPCIDELLWPFPHSRPLVNVFGEFAVEDIQMAPSYVRVIERILKDNDWKKNQTRIAAIDDSAVKKSSPIAEALDIELFTDLKKRISPNKAESMGGKGNVKGKTPIMTDDLVQSGSTFIKGANTLKAHDANGAVMVIGAPDFTYNEEENKWGHEIALEEDFIKLLVFFDTTPLVKLLRDEAVKTGKQDKVIVVKSATLFALYLWRKILNLSCDDLRQAKPRHSILK